MSSRYFILLRVINNIFPHEEVAKELKIIDRLNLRSGGSPTLINVCSKHYTNSQTCWQLQQASSPLIAEYICKSDDGH